MQSLLIFYNHLCLLARCSRYLAFCIAEPEPCAPVIYFFFFALVFTLPSSCFGRSPPLLNEMPLTRMSSKSLIVLFFMENVIKEKIRPPHRRIRGGLILHFESMMEQADAGECHRDAILVTGLNDIVITDRATCLCDELHA